MRMKSIVLAVVLALSLAGCAGQNTKPPCDCKPIIVNENIPAPAVVVKPHDYVADLKKGDADDVVAKAYVTTYKLWLIYAEALELALNPYREAAAKPIIKTTTTTNTTETTVPVERGK